MTGSTGKIDPEWWLIPSLHSQHHGLCGRQTGHRLTPAPLSNCSSSVPLVIMSSYQRASHHPPVSGVCLLILGYFVP